MSNASSWLTIPSTTSGTGSGTVSYSVAANSATTSRTGTMTIGGQTFTVNQAGSIQYTLSISKSGTGTGTVSNTPTGTSFNAGTVVTLTATADANSNFGGWGGACSGTTSPCMVTMNGNTSVTATFTLKTYTIAASTADSNGSISPAGTLTVNSGASQAFTVGPKTGYKISDVKADGNSVGAVSSYTFGNVMSNHTIQAAFSLVSPAPATVVSAVNAGGSQYASQTGITYLTDKYYSGGNTWRTWASIAGTADGRLYQSERYGNFSYSFSVPSGSYSVTLKFAEIYWSSPKRRVFNVMIGGKQVISNLDIFALVGKNKAYDVTIPVVVGNNGILKIDFVTVVDNAKVSAILVQTR